MEEERGRRTTSAMGQLDGDGRSKEDVTSGSGPSVGSPTSDPVKYGELVVLGYVS